ncbi:MAG: hypothetical protein HYS17_04320 [Micavibrio aeruginosavorus]|uniref:Lipoprotein n=1 Tax=Micavibrio aeruginosavorus TaxID=349221 RepID=A0A7T5R3R8_9BACT|nr:MAG: hypothetical protein HYS17_04320 [Micavibrio aeruginosavorus]
MRIWPLLFCGLLAACSASSGPARDYRPYLAEKGIHAISPQAIPHCHGYGCRLKSYATLSQTEEKKIALLFKPQMDAGQERAALAQAIGLFETFIGAKTGTGTDVAGTYVRLGNDQHDCVDESVNATIYLDLIKQKNWLRHHDVSTISTRIPLVGGGMGFHQTAVIVERGSGRRYAVDGWFHDNGHKAEIVPLDDWLYGWHPASTQ